MKEYNVGETVWWASCGTKHVKKECPVCYGKRRVVLVLGNGDECSIECNFCGKGYEGPRGYIEEYEWIADVKQIVIETKKIQETPGGFRSIEYGNHQHYIRTGELFETREEAETRVAQLITEHERQEEERLATRKEYDKNSYGWHVGYHKKQAAKARKDFEYHEAKAVAMKARSRWPVCSVCKDPYPPDAPHTDCYKVATGEEV
jgi:hypothetical protein